MQTKHQQLVSILIPAYNAEDHLATCLDSCLEQTYTNWEAICVNDGSDDGTGTILRKYAERDRRIKNVDLDENAGISNAIATARNHCTGSIIALLDSDDWYQPNHLERCLQAMRSTEADLINVDMNYFDEKLSLFDKVSNWNLHADWRFQLNEFESFSFNIGPTKVFKRYLLDGVRFKKGLSNLQDTCTSFQISVNSKKAIHIPETLYNRRIRPNSIYHSKRSPQQQLRDIEGVYKVFTEFLSLQNKEKKYTPVIEQWRCRMIYRYLEAAHDYGEEAYKEYLSTLKDIILSDVKYYLTDVINSEEYFRIRRETLDDLARFFSRKFHLQLSRDKRNFYRYKLLTYSPWHQSPGHIGMYNHLLRRMHGKNLALSAERIPKKVFRKNRLDFNIKHEQQLAEARKLLRDTHSLQIFNIRSERLGLSGNKPRIPLSNFPEYFHPEVLPEPGDWILDAGVSEDINVTFQFSLAVGTSGKVVGLEPEPDSFRRASDKLGEIDIDNVTIFDVGLWHKKATLRISQDSLSSSLLTAISKQSVTCDLVSLDEFVSDRNIKKIDFIKLDIEGAEPEALIGAEMTLRSKTPKLAVSIYHRPEHIFEVLLYLDSLQCGYKFWLGHHRDNMWSTILYARA
jgi:FkbM family methyltransferase